MAIIDSFSIGQSQKGGVLCYYIIYGLPAGESYTVEVKDRSTGIWYEKGSGTLNVDGVGSGSFQIYGGFGTYEYRAYLGSSYDSAPGNARKSGTLKLEDDDTPTTYAISLTVYYQAEGGSGGPTSQTKGASSYSTTGNITFNLETITPAYPGYTFAGWYYNGNVYQPGQSVTLEGSTSGRFYYFTAIWEKDGGLYIYNGTEWETLTPYIYNGTSWDDATLYVYDSEWTEV